jgi:hypothetical protein
MKKKRSMNELFAALNRGEIPSAEELDALRVSLNPADNIARRQQLQDKYPFLRATSIQEGLMAFGFECADGWLPILEKLFERFQELVDKEGSANRFRVTQVKEKYGTLRVYHNGGDAYEAFVDKAEALSEVTCELCGQQGMIRDDGWVMVRCDRCYKEKR